jgi:ribonucleoside-diphosphate reductase alpha chain
MDHGAQLIADIQLYDKYARWIPEQSRRETWHEVVQRVMTFFQQALAAQGKSVEPVLMGQLALAMAQKDVLPSMRVVQMAGPALARCHVGAFNCAYLELDGPAALGELLYILMQGTGVGYSVESRVTRRWSHVAAEAAGTVPVRVIADSTEGWCDALVKTIIWSMDGWTPQWDYSAIRPEGTWLHTKGGRASGPGPLQHLLTSTHQIIRAAAGRQLRPFEIHRLATLCGSIVQVGGVRRAAEICLFDPQDAEMASCKDGEFWTTYPELGMSNNSMVFTGSADPDAIRALVSHLSSVGSGEPGIFRRDGKIPVRRPRRHFGTNPCGEIILRSRQFCNLSIAVARPTDTLDTLRTKVRLATFFGTLQSCLTSFRYLDPEWAANTAEERLLGVDITGAVDCPLLHPSHPDLALTLGILKDVARYANHEISDILAIPSSTAITCNKPSGNSSQLLGTASGIHPRYAPTYIRRLRIAARSPLGLHLQALGLPCAPEVGQGTLDEAKVWVFELPVKSPEGAITRHQMTALDQLRYWHTWKKHWTEHNPSCTIYVKPDEWADVAEFLIAHWDDIGGLSFLPKDTTTYPLAPYEEITEAEYEARVAALPADLQLGTLRESADLTTVAQDYACLGGLCEL